MVLSDACDLRRLGPHLSSLHPFTDRYRICTNSLLLLISLVHHWTHDRLLFPPRDSRACLQWAIGHRPGIQLGRSLLAGLDHGGLDHNSFDNVWICIPARNSRLVRACKLRWSLHWGWRRESWIVWSNWTYLHSWGSRASIGRRRRELRRHHFYFEELVWLLIRWWLSANSNQTEINSTEIMDWKILVGSLNDFDYCKDRLD